MPNKYSGSTGLFLFTLIVPEQVLSPQTVRGRILRTLQIYGDKVTRDFEDTVATWQDPAVFDKPEVRYAGGNPRVTVTTDDDKWRWLNYGTDIRWAGMHPDFRPKTKPGTFQSGVGNPPYEPVWRGKSHMTSNKSGNPVQVQHQPRPGIEARNWTGLASNKYRKQLKEALRKAIREGLAAA